MAKGFDFCSEIHRAYKVLDWWDAETQNEVDIQSWLDDGLIDARDARAFSVLNRHIASLYEAGVNT